MITSVFAALLYHSLLFSLMTAGFALYVRFWGEGHRSNGIYKGYLLCLTGYFLPVEYLVKGTIRGMERVFAPYGGSLVNEVNNLKLTNVLDSISVPEKAETVFEWSCGDTAFFEAAAILGNLICVVWILGSLFLAGRCILKEFRCRRFYNRWSETILGEAAKKARIDRIVEEQGLGGRVQVLENRAADGPFCIGIWRMRVILPKTVVEGDEEELSCILRHELTHCARKDNLIKLLLLVVQILYWPNPFLCFLGRKINQYCELSCDEKALEGRERKERKKYGEALIHVLQYQNSLKTPTQHNFYDGKELMKRRLRLLFCEDRPKGAGWRLAALVLGMTLCISLTTPAYLYVQGKEGPMLYEKSREYGECETELERLLKEEPENVNAKEALLSRMNSLEKEAAELMEGYETILEPEERWKQYKERSLLYEEGTGTCLYQGKTVRFLEDGLRIGSAFVGMAFIQGKGEVDVVIRRDGEENLVSMEVYPIEESPDYIQENMVFDREGTEGDGVRLLVLGPYFFCAKIGEKQIFRNEEEGYG